MNSQMSYVVSSERIFRKLITSSQQQTISWTNVDLSPVKSNDIHQRAVLQEISQPPITKIRLKIIYHKFHSNLSGTNELIHGFQSSLFTQLLSTWCWYLRVGVTRPISSFCYLTYYLAFSKYTLFIEYHIHFWQVSLTLAKYECDALNLKGIFAGSKILFSKNGAFVTSTPGT